MYNLLKYYFLNLDIQEIVGMSGEYTENLDKLKKIFDEISESDLKTAKTYQEFLLKLHTAIKHQYVGFAKTRKSLDENWKSLKEQLATLEKTFEQVLLEKKETSEQLENMRNLLDEKIYALTTKEDEIETLIAENKNKEEEITRLKNDVEELKKQVERLSSGSVIVEEKEDEVIEKIVKGTDEEELNLHILNLKEELQNTKEEYENLKNRYEELVNSNNSLQKELENAQKELSEVLEQKDKRIDTLLLELEEKQRESQQLKALLEQSTTEEQVKSLSDELEKKKETIAQLEKQLAETVNRSEYEQIKQELIQSQDKLKTLESEIQNFQKEISEKDNLIKEQETKILRLEEALRDTPNKEEVESIKRQLDEKISEINILKEIKDEYDRLKYRYSELHTKYDQLESEIQELQNIKKSLEEKINILPTLEEWSNLQQEVINKNEEIRKLNETLAQERERFSNLQREKEELELGISSLEEKLLSLEEEVVDLQKSLSEAPDKESYERIQKAYETAKQEKDTIQSELQKLRTELQDYSKAKQSLEKELEQVKEELKGAPKLEDLKSLERKLSAVTTENQTLQRKLQELLKLKSLATMDDLKQIKEFINSVFENIEKIEETVRIGISEKEKVIEATTTILRKKKKPNLGEILLTAGIIDEKQLEEALAIQKENSMKHLGDILIEKGYVSEYAVAQSLAVQCNVPFVMLTEKEIIPEALNAVPPRILRQHNCIPLRITEQTLTVALPNPIDLVAIEDLEHASGKRVEVVVSTPSDIKNLLEKLVPVS